MLQSNTIDSGGSLGAPTHFRVHLEETPTACDHCRSFDGKVIPFDEYERGKNAPPFHPNCRCWAEILDARGNVLLRLGLELGGLKGEAWIRQIARELSALGLGDELFFRSDWKPADFSSAWVADHNKTGIAIHHTNRGSLVNIERNHISRGFDGIGYHFIIDPLGNIFEGRPLEMRGDHVGGANTGLIGIALMGNFEPRFLIGYSPSDYQIASLKTLTQTLQNMFSIPDSEVRGHGDFALPENPTVCPGGNLNNIILNTWR
jgi:hypothetical protein